LLRSIPRTVPRSRKIFPLYAYHSVSVEDLVDKLAEEGIIYRSSTPRFNRAALYHILRDRSYLGEVRFRRQWHPGTHQPLVDRVTWDRVQELLGDKVQHPRELVYAGLRRILPKTQL
jgi:site-specific DNA recombinase